MKRLMHGEQFNCSFDPAALVRTVGGLSWRWDGAAAARVSAAQNGAPELVLRYECTSRALYVGCAAARLTFVANGSVAFETAASGDVETADPPRYVAERVWGGYMRTSLAHVPRIRLELTYQADLEDVSRLPWVVASSGQDPAALPPWREGVAPAPPSSHPQSYPPLLRSDLSCETFANWRPASALWAALRQPLSEIDAWGGAVALLARTGGADHFSANPRALSVAQAAAASPSNHNRVGAILSPLFLPCANASLRAGVRFANAGEQPCATWHDAQPLRRSGPTVAQAAGCAGTGAGRSAALEAAAPYVSAAAAAAPGPLGAFVGCAFNAAAAIAAEAANATTRPPSSPLLFGVLVASDAPAVACLVESLGRSASFHLAAPASTLSAPFPGHVQYAPDALLPRVTKAALVDHYLIGLVDLVLPLTRSAYTGAGTLRRARPRVDPPGWDGAPFAPGVERWFESGRENFGGRGVDATLLALIATTSHGECPRAHAGVGRAARAYAHEAAAAAAGAEGGEQPRGG